jgi:glucose/arabinose dehydrogenase
MLLLPCTALCLDADGAPAGITASEPDHVGLDLIATGFAAPLALVPSPDDTGRLFVVDQIGQIRIIDEEGVVLDEPFLDLGDRMVGIRENFDERGLLGLAFHPDFSENGRFFIYYSVPLQTGAPSSYDHTSRISEFKTSDTDTNRANATSERILLSVDQPQSNHNAGQIAFGPDGYLYIPLGDGGGSGDVGPGHPPPGNGQNTSTVLGSILRIDVDGIGPYGIPIDNPFANGTYGREEIYAYGFRNPFRITFDAGDEGSLFVGDAGERRREEVSVVRNGGNYGWNIREGVQCFDSRIPADPPSDCPAVGPLGEPLIDPVIEYQNANVQGGIGLVVIGGYVYRGSALLNLEGDYVFGDWSRTWAEGDGTLLAARSPEEEGVLQERGEGSLWPIRELSVMVNDSTPPVPDASRIQMINQTGRIGAYIISFGQDADHELYLLTSDRTGPAGDTGSIYRLVPP